LSLSVLGLGTALPQHTVTQSLASEVAQKLAGSDEQSFSALYRKSGVVTRHMVLPPEVVMDWLFPGPGSHGLGPTTGERMRIYLEHATVLALPAAARAIEDAGIGPAEITHLVTVSCTGFHAPGVDLGLLAGLRLAPTLARTHIGFMGCHAAINGLRVAAAFAASDPRARVLLCAVELCSLHYHSGAERKKLVGNALFADGAAALVAGPAADGGRPWRLEATGSCLFPGCEDAMTWVIGDHGFEMALSRQVPELIRSHLRPWLSAWLDASGQSLSAVRSWAVHPGGPRILSAVEESLELAHGATRPSRDVLAACGNMSSPTILFILERLRREEAPLPCVALGFGPGLVAEAALFI
jgi:predicted naringenin-chalcone synthase